MIHEHASRVCEGGVNMFAMKIIFHLTTFLTCFATFWGDDDSGGWICCGVARYFVYSDISSLRKPCKIMKNICQLKVRSISDRYRYLPFVSSRCTCSYCWLMMGEDVWEKTLHWSVVTTLVPMTLVQVGVGVSCSETPTSWSLSSLHCHWWSVWNRLGQLNSRNNVHMLRPLDHCLHEKLWSLRSDAAVLIISYAPN